MRWLAPLFLLVLAPLAGAWTWPVHGPVLQAFSFDPAHPYAAGQHRGIDVGADAGSSVRAPASGVVSFAGTVPTSGKVVTIDTPGGLAVTLTHLGSIAVAKGATVAEGAVVGTVGPSGTPDFDAPYVHMGVRDASNPEGYLDPLSFLPAVPALVTTPATPPAPGATQPSAQEAPPATAPPAAQTPATPPAPAQPASAQPASAQPASAEPAGAEPATAQPATPAMHLPTATPSVQAPAHAPPVATPAEHAAPAVRPSRLRAPAAAAPAGHGKAPAAGTARPLRVVRPLPLVSAPPARVRAAGARATTRLEPAGRPSRVLPEAYAAPGVLVRHDARHGRLPLLF